MSNAGNSRFLSEPLEARVLLAGEPWGAFPKLINQDDAIGHYPSINGSGQAVAIIDTGIDYNHPSLGGGFGPSYKVIAGYDFVDNDSNPIDEQGHGTGIAGVIGAKDFVYNGAHYRGLAPSAKLIALRTSDDEASREEEDLRIEQALQWVISHRTQYNIVAVNLSLGTGAYAEPTQTGPYWDEMESLANSGVFIAAAAGNGGVSSPFAIEYPGIDPSAYAIGSINSSDVISRFTERSQYLDLLAPGENMPTTYWDPSTRKHIYVAGTGTSFATPFAAAAAALLKQVDPTLSPAQIMDILSSSGAPNYDGDSERGEVTNLTFPRLNIDAAIGMALRNGDDALEENDSISAARMLGFSGDSAGADNLRLMAGDSDYFKFTLSAAAKVTFSLGTDSGSRPTFELYSASGSRIASLGTSTTRELTAGTYVLKVSALATTMQGAYWIDIDKQNLAQPPGLSGGVNDIAYDSHGQLHIAWYDASSQNLKYIMRSSAGVWSTVRIVDKSFGAGKHLSLAVDRKGGVGIAYYDSGNQDLKYAQLKGGAFNITKIDSKGAVGEYPSLAFNSAARPAISYYSKSGGNLKLATMGSGGKWSISTVDSSGDTGRYSSLAVNTKSNNWSIGYLTSSGGVFRYAEKTKSGKWKLHTVEDTRKGGGFVSLAFDRAGRPGMSYYVADGEDLHYAHFDGHKWTKQTVASRGRQGQYSTLMYDSAGQPSIVFYDASNDAGVLATANSGRWTLSGIAASGGSFISASTGAAGIRGFLYRDSASGMLMFGAT